MTYAYHWRKAMVMSVCLHMFFIIGAGYLAAGWTAPLPTTEEVMLEMDLVSDLGERPENSNTVPETATLPEALKPISAEMSPVMPVDTETKVSESESVVTTSELAMTAAENPTTTRSQSSNSASTTTDNSPAAVPIVGGGSRSGIAAPLILSKSDPVYPSAARQAGLEGTVILKIQILANGRPGDIAVARSTGHAVLDEAAITAVEKWRFVPAKDRTSGRAMACTTTLPVSFHLH
ncbi:energy transducer TonB [Pelosinus sp. UFO1]|uniref:energy transducer TonB n=1 Tax=Pelosinus sp. UFO1 TaxID=484770 RepID=UPI0004D18738|nr:energy transducer TonB [Pelosinus sp. UFO1]AIF49886.1 TonB family protein [Pelosinus sp. UFO1]